MCAYNIFVEVVNMYNLIVYMNAVCSNKKNN